MTRSCSLALAVLVFPQAWAAFDRPAEQERLRALGNLYEEPAALRSLLRPDDNFFPITLPGPKDWLAQHIERGQTFDEYRNAPVNVPDQERRIIYLMPIGEFDEERSPPLEELRAYAAAFFQIEVKLLPAYHPHDLEFEPRRNPRSGQRQILTRSVTKFLEHRVPKDGFCLLGVTMEDLYPDPAWNFVFGEASLNDRVGIYSFARDDPAFWDDPRPANYRDQILRRSVKTLVHETAHMFTFLHCIYFDCVMNGANHLVEADSRPQHLCPICLRKLHYAASFDAAKRYEALALFYRRHQWYEEYDWVQRQLARLKPAAG
jgi:archaemetzincin